MAPLGPPVVLFSASHSGSRLLAQMVRRLGVFMGADLNESEDSLPIFDLVRYVVETHAPDYSRLLDEGDPALPGRIRDAFAAHLAVRPVGRWGWKLPETGHVLPVVTRLFPRSHYIHLVRDGRDVAFSPFVAPKAAFWRKIYFNTDRITSWHGLAMTQRAYRAQGHRFNAARWVNSVTLGRTHGAALGARFLELSYEAVVADPQARRSNSWRPSSKIQRAAWRRSRRAEVRADRPCKWRRGAQARRSPTCAPSWSPRCRPSAMSGRRAPEPARRGANCSATGLRRAWRRGRGVGRSWAPSPGAGGCSGSEHDADPLDRRWPCRQPRCGGERTGL